MNGSPGDGPVIVVDDVTLGYGDRVVQQHLTFEVRRGEVFVILGVSGSGKSTLLKNMIGLCEPMRGKVSIDGTNVVTARGEERARLLRQFGVMYQSGALFGSMTLLENVRLPLDEFTELHSDEKDLVALAKLNQVGIRAAAWKTPAEVSGGMKKRAAIARAMALDPFLLFLDEPSSGLDPITSAGLDALIRFLSMDFGITFVVVTHELQSTYAIADRCVLLDARTKTIIAEGKPADLRDHSEDPTVRRFFRREADPQGGVP
ncbi:ABC transporter ATP-binding protein [Anaeromyxobacter oryzae]|uniref:ABC transporter ATP-binding protein n=1 Tax=Anaeromyxobacter oryzae TaxID=2918170 RepID=A0ABM7WPX7_9BACT|nr:ATP-binding cassette domain-containing protein [Anaeromyxobacter oryzae]BDG01524.1 ABC transporter ATP-binding protein [Anaeromyxobacter oryzae]